MPGNAYIVVATPHPEGATTEDAALAAALAQEAANQTGREHVVAVVLETFPPRKPEDQL